MYNARKHFSRLFAWKAEILISKVSHRYLYCLICSRYQVSGIQDPDLIRSTVRRSPVQPDVCIPGSFSETPVLVDAYNSKTLTINSEYGTLVSSINIKGKGQESACEDSFNSEDSATGYPKTRPLLQGKKAPTPALDISPDSLWGERSHRTYNSKLSESPMASSCSSLSGSESRSSTPVSKIQFRLDSCTHCDHRLKLYLETRLFKGGEDEQFSCMIKVRACIYRPSFMLHCLVQLKAMPKNIVL